MKMLVRILVTFVTLCFKLISATVEPRVAVAHLVTENITGSVYFTETDEGLRVSGEITGLGVGKYGFHIHELGDTRTCYTTGAHFNPDSVNHGGRDHDVRHIGDLGNVEFTGAGTPVANFSFVDNLISLRGRYSILGRSLVLHEQEDDLGLGGHETSLTTGNAGARVACGIVGIQSPNSPWNSAGSVLPSLILLTSALIAFVGMS